MGEEAFFRGFLQNSVVASLGGLLPPGLGAGWATAAGVGATSVVFGALHALTPTYFVLATVAGVLFGAWCPPFACCAAAM